MYLVSFSHFCGFCGGQDLVLILVCNPNYKLEADGYQNHQSGEEPVARSVRTTGKITINITQGRSQAKAQRVGGIENTQNN